LIDGWRDFVSLLSLSHLVEDLELHHQLPAGQRPHPEAAILTAGGEVALVRAERHVIHLEQEEEQEEEEEQRKEEEEQEEQEEEEEEDQEEEEQEEEE